MLVKAASWEHNDQIPCICTLMMMSESFDHNQHSWLNWLSRLVTSLPQFKKQWRNLTKWVLFKNSLSAVFAHTKYTLPLCFDCFKRNRLQLCIKSLTFFYFCSREIKQCSMVICRHRPPIASLPNSKKRCFMKSFESYIKGPTIEMMVLCLSFPLLLDNKKLDKLKI